MRLSKNKILITGATAGIGRALAENFLKLENEIIAVGRNDEKLAELAELGTGIIPFKCDISMRSEVNKLIDFVEKEHQDLNILINNAGIQFNYNFDEQSEILSKIEMEVEVNLISPLKLTAWLLPIIQKNENSAIVNVSSALAIVPKKDAPVYCATKAAIHVFSKSLRYQLEKVKVFEIIPPLVDTAMVAGRGKGKISPQELVDEFLRAFKRNKYEVNVGKVKLLRVINRILPALADRIINS